MARKKTKFSKLALGFVEFIGLALSVYLFLISMKFIYAGEVPCPRSKWFECKSVVRGQFSHIGPIPIAGLGVFYFLMQLALTIAMGKKGTAKYLKGVTILSGLIFVGGLRAIEFVWLRKVCPWCWGVAVTVLVEAIVAWPGLIPPLPKFKLPGRIAAVTAAFILLVAGSVAVGFEVKKQQKETRLAAESSKPKATPKPTKTPAAAEKTPKPTATPRVVAANSPTPLPRPKETPTPTPRPQFDLAAEPEPEIDTPEVGILKSRGWKLVARTSSVERAVKELAPAVLLTFDPYCEECHWLINNGLNSPEIDALPVTKIAIEQSSLEGWISDQVKAMPSILVFDPNGQIVFKHEGRMKTQQFINAVTTSLGYQ